MDDFDQFFMVEGVNETIDNVNKALKKVAANIFPADAVMNMKTYLNFEAKKPNKLTARETMTRLERINKWLGEYFPSDGGDRTKDVDKLEAKELKLIYYRLLPSVWRRKMDENGSFSHHEATLQEIVEYAERLEVTEQCYGGGGNPKGSAIKKNGQQGKMKSGSSQGGPKAGRTNGSGNRQHNKTGDCRVYGPNCGHSSHQCKVLMGHAEKVRTQWEAQPKGRVHRKKPAPIKFKNSITEERKFSRSEVNAMLGKLKQKLEEGKRNELNVMVNAVDEPMEDGELEALLNDVANE